MFNNNLPNPMMQNGFNPQMMIPNMMNNSMIDFDTRLNRLERQIKRLDQRITRLETPFASNDDLYNNEPDSSMYMI